MSNRPPTISFLYVTDLFRQYEGEQSHIVVKGTYKPKGEDKPLQFQADWFDLDEYQTIQCKLKIEGFWVDSDEVVTVIAKENVDIVPINKIAQSLAIIFKNMEG